MQKEEAKPLRAAVLLQEPLRDVSLMTDFLANEHVSFLQPDLMLLLILKEW